MPVHLKDLNQESFSWLLRHPCWLPGLQKISIFRLSLDVRSTWTC